MDTFHLLSTKMQRLVWELRWKKFSRIQDQAIPLIIQTQDDVILSSGTASGKTEAAFLPILSLVEDTAPSELNVLYVSPLKALINNQFERIEKLCSLSNIAVHRWHGDVNQSAKRAFVKNPTGVLQITPESIESLFLNRTSYLPTLFTHLRFIVIDEVHAFLDTERGVHLQSLISRILPFCNDHVRVIGLSATIGNPEGAKRWLCPTSPEHVQVVTADSGRRELLGYLMHFSGEGALLPVELYEDLRQVTRDQKALIFCNSRSRVEECTVFLNRLAEREGVGETYYAHHSSIDKKERERVEDILATTPYPKSVISTSTLELGIDIGNIDIAVQVDGTFTVSSLKQRLGRTGRRDNDPQVLQLYTTQVDSLVQSIAVMELLLEGWVEPNTGYSLPYDILVHQLISLCHQFNGLSYASLVDMVRLNRAFHELPTTAVEQLIQYLIKQDTLEQVRGSGEIIVGLEGEKILRRKDFYAVFMTPEEYHVVHGNREIGRLDKGVVLAEGNNIILAGRLWTITLIDEHHSKIHVSPAVDAKPPQYLGGGAHLHPRIPEMMWNILYSNKEFSYIDDEARDLLWATRQTYHLHQLTQAERVCWLIDGVPTLEAYTGSVIGRTLMWMLRFVGAPAATADPFGRIKFTKSCDVPGMIEDICTREWTQEDIVTVVRDQELFRSKFTPLMPLELVNSMHASHEFDILGTLDFLKSIRLRAL